jgi:hypothetical protein
LTGDRVRSLFTRAEVKGCDGLAISGEQSDSGRSVYSTDMYGTKILANGKCQYKRPVPDVQTQSLACCEYY